MKGTLILFLILALLCAPGTYSAGTSTGTSEGSGDSGTDPGSTATENTLPDPIPDCEENPNLQGRIQCRLLNPLQEESIPEPCRASADIVSCTRLYSESEDCYGLSPSKKSTCFKTAAGFYQKEMPASDIAARNYAILLLYELQERVEDRFKDKKIDSYKASKIIESIEKIKIALLNSKSRSEVKDMLIGLKSSWDSDMK